MLLFAFCRFSVRRKSNGLIFKKIRKQRSNKSWRNDANFGKLHGTIGTRKNWFTYAISQVTPGINIELIIIML